MLHCGATFLLLHEWNMCKVWEESKEIQRPPPVCVSLHKLGVLFEKAFLHCGGEGGGLTRKGGGLVAHHASPRSLRSGVRIIGYTMQRHKSPSGSEALRCGDHFKAWLSVVRRDSAALSSACVCLFGLNTNSSNNRRKLRDASSAFS